MKVLILAARRRTGISKFTKGEPKCLIKINDQTILEQQIQFLNNAGIQRKDIIIVTGYRSKSIKETIGTDIRYIHNEKYKSTNSLYSMWLARFEDFSNGMLLFNADVIFHQKILFKLINSKSNSVAVDFNKKLIKGEMNVLLDSDNILEISKSIDIRKAGGESVQLCKFDKYGVDILFKESDKLIKKNLYNKYFPAYVFKHIIKDLGLYAVNIENYPWAEIDYKEDLEQVENKKWI